MGERDDADASGDDRDDGATPHETGATDEVDDDLRATIESLRETLEGIEGETTDLRGEVEDLAAEVEDRTVHREEIEEDLRRYVRARVRRGHARGWGPYLVLLYGTAMTIAAFTSLSGGWAILAMVVVWLSTLGLYTLMVLFGLAFTALSAPGRAMEAARSLTDTLRGLRP